MDTKDNNSRQNTHCTAQTGTSTNRRRKNIDTNQKDKNKRKESNKRIGKTRWTSMGKRQNHLYEWQNLCTKKQTTLR